MTKTLNAFKPSEVILNIPPLVGTLKHAESEAAAAMLVRAMRVRGDTWAPVAPREMGKVLNDDLDGNVEPLASLNRNPFFRPNFEQLADDGFARWIGDRLASAIEFTPAGIEALRRWVRPQIPTVQHSTQQYATKPLLWGKHCRGLGCDDFNEQQPSCVCACAACKPPITEPASPPPGYARRNPQSLEPYYSAHVSAMTSEGLHYKTDIAAELAFRDAEISKLRMALATQRQGNVALMGVFSAAAKVCDCWDAAASHSDAKARLQTAVEAYRELVAPLGEHGGTDPEQPTVQP